MGGKRNESKTTTSNLTNSIATIMALTMVGVGGTMAIVRSNSSRVGGKIQTMRGKLIISLNCYPALSITVASLVARHRRMNMCTVSMIQRIAEGDIHHPVQDLVPVPAPVPVHDRGRDQDHILAPARHEHLRLVILSNVTDDERQVQVYLEVSALVLGLPVGEV